jgi:hypothetical protein
MNPARRERRSSADWQSAVSQIDNLRASADCQSAIRQINNLRYGQSWQRYPKRFHSSSAHEI